MDISNLLDKRQIELLKKNGDENHYKNTLPIAYLEIVNLGYQFLLTEINSKQPHMAYGLSDYDTDLKIGEIDLDQLSKLADDNNADIVSMWDFQGKYSIAVYIKVAESIGTIVTDTSKEGYKKEFQKFAVGKNIDPGQDLRYLKNRFTWL